MTLKPTVDMDVVEAIEEHLEQNVWTTIEGRGKPIGDPADGLLRITAKGRWRLKHDGFGMTHRYSRPMFEVIKPFMSDEDGAAWIGDILTSAQGCQTCCDLQYPGRVCGLHVDQATIRIFTPPVIADAYARLTAVLEATRPLRERDPHGFDPEF